MERLRDEVNLCEVKTVNLGEAWEKFQSEASGVVVLSLQWRDLEDHLRSVKGKVEERFVELQNRSFEIEERARVVEAWEVKADGFRREVEVREEELSGLRMKQRLMKESLRETQVEIDLKGGELAQMERRRVEAETRKRELDEEIKRKTRDLTLVQDKVTECGKLLETRSLELTKTLCELDLKVEQLGHVKSEFTAEMEHLERVQTRNRELEEDIERKRKDLAEVLNKTAECGKQLEARSLELVSKEKKLQELSLDLDLKEDIAISLDNEMESKAKELEGIEKLINERSGHCESIKLLIEEVTEELASEEKRHDEMTEASRKLSVEIESKEDTVTERNKQAEEGEKKILDLNNTNEELIRQVKVRQEQVSSINEAIRECICELEAKRKQRDEVQSSITDLTVDLKSKESHLSSIEKKIQESLKDMQSTEEQQVKLKASLMEHEQGLELREKELIAREEKVNEQDQKVQLAIEELAKWVEDYEVKAKQLVALTPLDMDRPTGNSRKRGRYDGESLSQSLDHVLTSCTTGQESNYNFENLRSPDKFKTDQIWAVYSDSDKGMPRKYVQIKKIDTSPEFNIHVALLVLYRPPPNLTTHPVCCGRFKLKIGKAEVLEPSSFSHKVNAVKSSVNRYEVYPGKGEVWALYKNWNTTCSAETGEEHEIVEIVETNEQSIQAMLLTAQVFNKLLYGRCLESKTDVVDIPKTEVNRFSHQIPAFRRDRRATRSGDCEWWELDSKAVLDLNSKKP
ncbi:CAP-Gly domain-containing linker protein 1-like [Raphanus sativus]|uniref:Uncharacterized protein LOC108807375 n=1 Tax=Raphanus sativus TaxID=3726 RepID=A0A6J0JHQ2_RAPSA|nr:uncharacterized protein LOC108807375 [Raphanus sativus]KAJ4888019.1 CAP-Gly domain-containing linker protein 1-like [Raphanus sativus]